MVNELRATLTPDHRGREQLIVTTQAISDVGIEELYRAIDQYRKNCQKHREFTEQGPVRFSCM